VTLKDEDGSREIIVTGRRDRKKIQGRASHNMEKFKPSLSEFERKSAEYAAAVTSECQTKEK